MLKGLNLEDSAIYILRYPLVGISSYGNILRLIKLLSLTEIQENIISLSSPADKIHCVVTISFQLASHAG